jgi:altronate hydrolase
MSTTYIAEAAPISEYAIVVDPRDNLAVVKVATEPGLELTLSDDRVIRVTGIVPPGHRFATRDIPPGEFVRQYGQPIGTSLGIK